MKSRRRFRFIDLLVLVTFFAIFILIVVFANKGKQEPQGAPQPGGDGIPLGAGEIPTLRGPVNDYAGVISAEREEQLAKTLLDQESKTSNQIVILTVKSLGGDTIEGFSEKVFRAWKLGDAEKDNGVLVVNATDERKIRIEVGFGLEGVLTDALASRIIDDEMVPRFKEGDFDGGFTAGVSAIDAAIRGEYQAGAGGGDNARAGNAWGVAVLFAFVVFFFILIIIASKSKGGGSGSSGGFFGSSGGGGGFSGGGGYSGGGGSSGGGGASGGY